MTDFEIALSNKVYLENNMVVKKSLYNNLPLYNRQNQLNLEKIIKDNIKNVVIPIKSFFDSDGVFTSYTPYIKNAMNINLKSLDTDKLIQIKDIIDELHNLKLENNSINKFEYIKLIDFFSKSDNHPPIIVELSNKYYNKNYIKFVVSHNDLVIGNFLDVNNKIYLIDFEMACLNHHLFDYASFISETLIDNKKLVTAFLKLNNFTKSQKQDINNLIILQDYLWMQWANYLYKITDNLIYKNIYNQKKISYETDWFKDFL